MLTLQQRASLQSSEPLAVQWLRLHASNAGILGLIPGQGTKIPHATQHSQKHKYTDVHADKSCPQILVAVFVTGMGTPHTPAS